jgi:hypothetical protein
MVVDYRCPDFGTTCLVIVAIAHDLRFLRPDDHSGHRLSYLIGPDRLDLGDPRLDQFGQVLLPQKHFVRFCDLRSDPHPPLRARTMDYPQRYAPRTLPRSGSYPVEKSSFCSSRRGCDKSLEV